MYFDFYEHVERLDYSITVPSINGLETAHYFVEHPVYGTTGYPTYEDACEDMHGILGIRQFLDTVESMIQAGFVGDQYIFNSQNMLVKVRSDYEYWTWTPETGIVYDPEPEQDTRPNRKQRRSARRVQNKRHKQSDRAHGKKRMPSAKFVREADRQDIYHAHAKFVWHESHKGEWIPRTVKKHEKFRKERFVPSPDWDGEPDPLMPAERLERNQKIEQLKNQLDVLDWEMEDVTDRIHWCHEDLQEIEWHKNREAEVRQSLKEWQDRLATLSRQYNDLTERIMNLA